MEDAKLIRILQSINLNEKKQSADFQMSAIEFDDYLKYIKANRYAVDITVREIEGVIFYSNLKKAFLTSKGHDFLLQHNSAS